MDKQVHCHTENIPGTMLEVETKAHLRQLRAALAVEGWVACSWEGAME